MKLGIGCDDGTNQTVEAVIQEDQKHSLFLHSQDSVLACQHSLHNTFEEEREMARLFLEDLIEVTESKDYFTCSLKLCAHIVKELICGSIQLQNLELY